MIALLTTQIDHNMQLLFARIITGAKRGTSHKYLYEELGWSTLAERRRVAKLKFIHKMYHNVAPEYLVDLLPEPANANVCYNLRFGGNTEQLLNNLGGLGYQNVLGCGTEYLYQFARMFV